jgi:hypothetical protein
MIKKTSTGTYGALNITSRCQRRVPHWIVPERPTGNTCLSIFSLGQCGGTIRVVVHEYLLSEKMTLEQKKESFTVYGNWNFTTAVTGGLSIHYKECQIKGTDN